MCFPDGVLQQEEPSFNEDILSAPAHVVHSRDGSKSESQEKVEVSSSLWKPLGR